MTHKDLPRQAQELLSAEQKKLIDNGLARGAAFIIRGPQGPTGKSTLKRGLRQIGAQAYESYEVVEITLSDFLDS